MTISPTPTEAEKVVAELSDEHFIRNGLADGTLQSVGASAIRTLVEKIDRQTALIESQLALIESRDDELIGERWHADEAARQRDVWKARAEAAEARVTALEAEKAGAWEAGMREAARIAEQRLEDDPGYYVYADGHDIAVEIRGAIRARAALSSTEVKNDGA